MARSRLEQSDREKRSFLLKGSQEIEAWRKRERDSLAVETGRSLTLRDNKSNAHSKITISKENRITHRYCLFSVPISS